MSDTILLIVGVAMGTALLLGLSLCAGFWAGMQVGARGHAALEGELERLRSERGQWLGKLDDLTAGVEASHEQSEVVGLLAQSAGDSISSELVAAVNQMLQTTRKLAHELQALQPQTSEGCVIHMGSVAKPVSQPQHPLMVVEDEMSVPTLTHNEMLEVTGQHCLLDTDEELQTRRYLYDCVQRLAACEEDEAFPASAAFQSVRCHDISVNGVSFLWPAIPEFTRAILTVGPPSAPLYMMIEVTQFKSVFKHGAVCFLVGGKFVGRLGRAPLERRNAEAVLCS